MKLKALLALTAVLLLPVRATAFLIEGEEIIEYGEGDKLVTTTPFQESQRWAEAQTFTQGVGHISIQTSTYKSTSTATLIAPNLLLTCAHSFEGKGLDDKKVFNITVNGRFYTSDIIDIYLPYDNLPFGEKGDIAIALLNDPIIMDSYLAITNIDVRQAIRKMIDANKKPEFMGVSAAELKKNGNPLEKAIKGRHVGVFTLKESNYWEPLVSTFRLPDTYNHDFYKDSFQTSNFMPVFDYKYQQTQLYLKNGLHACFQAGDSGSPLLANFDGEIQIVGVASGQAINEDYASAQIISGDYTGAEEFNEDDNFKPLFYQPGNSFENHWTAVNNYGPSMTEILHKYNALEYQPYLKNFSGF